MAIGTPVSRGTGNNNVAGTSLVITPASNFTAGSHAILCVAYDNSGASGADPYASISDSVGNNWISRQAALYDPGAASAGITLRIFHCPLTTALTTAHSITVSFGANSTTAKAWVLMEATVSAGSILRYITGGVNTGAASAAPTVTTGSITSGDLVIGAGAAESADTWAGDADTTNGSWTTHLHNAAGTGTSGASVTAQGKVATGTGTQTYNPTLTSADCILAWAQFREVAMTLTAATGSFTLTGNTATFSKSRVLIAAAASFILTGNNVNFQLNRVLTASPGTFALTGNNANFSRTRTLAASGGTYVLTGRDVNFLRNRVLSASSGTFVLSGNAVNFLRNRVLSVSQGTFTLTGNTANFLFNRRLTASPGTFNLTGRNATFALIPAGSNSLLAGTGSFILTGGTANFYHNRVLQALGGTFNLTGNQAQFLRERRLQADSGAFVLTGGNATFTLDNPALDPDYFIDLISPIKTDYDCISPMDSVNMDSPIIDFVNLKSQIYES